MDGTRVAAPAASIGRGRNELRLEVVERNGDDFIIEGRVSVRDYGAAAACDVAIEELTKWRSQLASVYGALSGEAVLRQPGFELTMVAHSGGRVIVEGLFDSESGWGDGERAVLRFRLPTLDQTDLPRVIDMLDAALEMPSNEDEDG